MSSKLKQISQQMMPMISFQITHHPATLSIFRILQQIDWSLLQYLEANPIKIEEILSPENIKNAPQANCEPIIQQYASLSIKNTQPKTNYYKFILQENTFAKGKIYEEIINRDEKTTSKWWLASNWTTINSHENITMMNNKSNNLYITNYQELTVPEIKIANADSADPWVSTLDNEATRKSLNEKYREFYQHRPIVVKLLSNQTYIIRDETFTTNEIFALIKAMEIIKQLDDNVSYSNSILATVAELIYEQTKDDMIIQNESDDDDSEPAPQQNSEKQELSPSVEHFLQTYSPNINHESSQVALPSLTNRDFGQFLNDLKHHRPIDSKFVTWMLYATNRQTEVQREKTETSPLNSEFIQTILKSMNLGDFMELSDENLDDNQALIDELNKDDGFKNNYKICDIYDIHDNRPIDNNLFLDKSNIHQKLLTHGTANSSVLTIIRDGLLSRQELHADAQTSFTGLGLGNGVYFAQMYQAGKSASYTNSYSSYADMNYLFIADVYYSKIYETNRYGTPDSQDWDLLLANGVGSYNRDELVAKSGYQVRVRKMLAIKHK